MFGLRAFFLRRYKEGSTLTKIFGRGLSKLQAAAYTSLMSWNKDSSRMPR
jgi:hypothetical protein